MPEHSKPTPAPAPSPAPATPALVHNHAFGPTPVFVAAPEEQDAAPKAKPEPRPVKAPCPVCGAAGVPYEGSNPHKQGTHTCPAGDPRY